jgi:DNA-binding response OmpR family regulator
MSLEVIEIVEDDRSQAMLLDRILRQASFRTNVAFDGPSGMQDVWRNQTGIGPWPTTICPA